MKISSRLFAAMLVAGLSFNAQAGDAANGKALFTSKICVTCHGPDGKAPIAPNYPKLAGQSAAYIALAIKAYKEGKRSSTNAMTMQPMANMVNDAEVADIAAYLSGL